MQLDCPQCAKPVPWDGKMNSPVQIMKCPFCGHRFSSNLSHAPSAPFDASTAQSEETWELDVDADPITSSSSLMEDFEMMEEASNFADGATLPHFVRPPLETLSSTSPEMVVPDLPDIPLPMSNIIKMGGSNWDNILDEVDENIPALPPLGFELKEAAAEDLAPKQSETIAVPKHPKVAPRPSPSVPPEPPPVFSSKPPPGTFHTQEKPSNLSDLLESFVEEVSTEDETRYYIQRNQKEFGPFTEQEVMKLLETRKLKGEEFVRYADSTIWTPLEQSPDFQPTIEVLRKVPVRVGWEKSSPPPNESVSTASYKETDLPPLFTPSSSDLPASIHSQHPSPPGFMQRLNHNRRLLFASMGGVLLVVLALFWWSSSRQPSNQPKISQKNPLERLILKDHFPDYKPLLHEVTQSFQRGTFSPSWYNIRFAYALLDSFGDDRAIRAQAEPIYAALQQRKPASLFIQKIALLRAISLKDHKQAEQGLSRLQKKLPLSHPEWGYVFARALELTGKYESARLLYTKLLDKYPQHIRATLGLYRVLKALQKPLQASSYLLKAFRQAPTHLPSQLAALTYALDQGTWLMFRPQIRKNLDAIVQQGYHTQGGLARWYTLQARELWSLRQTDQAIYRMDQAIVLAPDLRELRWQRIQYYLWAKKPHLAQQAIRNETNANTDPTLILWDFLALLQYGTQQNIVKFLEPISQKATSSATSQYLYFYLLALSYIQQQDPSNAITSCLSAVRVKDPKIPRPHAHLLLLRLYAQENEWKKVAKTLEELGQIGYSSPVTEYYQGLFLAHDKKEAEAHKLAQQIQQRYPTNHHGYLLSARLSIQAKDADGALRFFRKALLYHPERPSPILLQMGDLLLTHQKPLQAYELFVRYEKLAGGEVSCDLLQKKLRALFLAKECQKLLQHPTQSCKGFHIHFSRGGCAEQLNQHELAMTEYKQAQLSAPSLLEPLEAIANLHFQQNQYTEAKELYTKLQQKVPQNPLYLARLLQLLRREQLYSQALSLLEEHETNFQKDFVIQLEKAHLLLGASKIRPAQKQLSQLQENFTAAPQVLQTLYVEAILHKKKRKPTLAIKTYTKILEQDQKQTEAYLARGKLYLQTRNYSACVQDFDKLIQLEPNHGLLKTIELWRDTCKQKSSR